MNLDHVFIDLALSSVDLAKGHITAIAAVRTDHRGAVRKSQTGPSADPRAAYSQAILAPDGSGEEDAVSFKDAIEGLKKVILAAEYHESYVVVAHFAEVDRAFLRKACESGHIVEPFKGRAWLDTVQLAWPLAYNDMIPTRDLDAIAKHFGIKNVAPDTCTGDCEALVRTYWTMMKRYRLAMMGEEAFRNVAGEGISNAVSKIGSLIGV